MTNQKFVGWQNHPFQKCHWKGKPAGASPSHCHTTKLYSLEGLQSKRFFPPGMQGLCFGAEYHLCACNGKWQLLPKVFLRKKAWSDHVCSYRLSCKGESQISFTTQVTALWAYRSKRYLCQWVVEIPALIALFWSTSKLSFTAGRTPGPSLFACSPTTPEWSVFC